MKRFLLAVLLLAVTPMVWSACVVTGTGQIVDGRDPACFPLLDEAKCSHYATLGGKTVGAATIDVDDAKKYGKKVMNFSNARVCEDKPNCGPYVAQFASEAKCDGKAVQDMPGGEYRGLTALKARQILEYNNRQLEAMAGEGEARGAKGKGQGKGRLWGNDK
ncbi:MAG TPA: hypothetical protein VF077_11390 [Nitrospiraceae bacterium]